jgi:hypothetical protein
MVITINKFDGTITQGMSLAEKKCRRQPRPAWSVPLADASRTVKYWKIKIGGIQTKKDVSETLNKIGKDLKSDQLPQTNSMDDVKRELMQAQKDLNKCRKEATALRKEFLDEKIEAAAIAEDTTSEKLLKKLRHREAQSACFRKLTCALKTNGATKGGVTKVELKIGEDTVAFTEKSDVERETKRRNQAHFNQPAGSPFTIFPLSETDTTATNFKTDSLPNGHKVEMPVDTFLETNTILDLLHTPLPGAAQAQISSRITLADFTTAIKVWSEKTSASPSGRPIKYW